MMAKDLTNIGGGASGIILGIIAARTLPAINAVIIGAYDRPGKNTCNGQWSLQLH